MFELLLMLLTLAMPPNFPSSPVVSQELAGDSLVSVHQDKSVSMVFALEDGLGCAVADAPQGQNPAPVPTLQSSWKSDDGSTHTVTTPIPASTPQSLENTIQFHRNLVDRMKQIYPPARP